MLARRDRPGREGKAFVPLDGLAREVPALLEEIQAGLLVRAQDFLEENTTQPGSYDDFRVAVADGFARAYWCGDGSCETRIQEETQATTRCIPLDQPQEVGRCIVCGKPAEEMAIFARAY